MFLTVLFYHTEAFWEQEIRKVWIPYVRNTLDIQDNIGKGLLQTSPIIKRWISKKMTIIFNKRH